MNHDSLASHLSREAVRVYRAKGFVHTLRLRIELRESATGFRVEVSKQLESRGVKFYKNSPDSLKRFKTKDEAFQAYLSVEGEDLDQYNKLKAVNLA